MTEKFSYYDLLAYLVPGTVVVWAAIQCAKTLGILKFISTGSGFIDGAGFVVIAFLAGHLVQAEAQRRLDKPDKSPLYPNGLPSYLFLVAGQKDENGKPWCSEDRRTDYVAAARRHKLLDNDRVSLLEGPSEGDTLQLAKQTSHEVYRAAFSLLTDEGRAQKAVVANQTYGLFRGLMMTCTVVSVLFSIILVVGLIEALVTQPDLLGTWPGFAQIVLYPVVAIVLFAYGSWSFKLRARNRGKHHVREVFDALLGAPLPAGEAAGG